MDDYIKNIAKKLISEEIDKRIFDIENKIFENKDMKKQMCSECGGKMYEGECMECGSMYEGDIQELGGMNDGHPKFGKMKFKSPMSMEDIEKILRGDDSEEDDDFKFKAPSPDYDYDEEDISFEDDDLENIEKVRKHVKIKKDLEENEDCYECGYNESEFNETKKLSKGQEYIAKQAKPYGKITGADFKALRSMKKEVEETLYELDLEEEDVEEGNAFSGALSAARKRGDKTFRVGGKTYPVEESYITEKWKGDVEVEQTGEYADMSVEEIDSAIKKLKKRNAELKRLGKKVPSSSREKMGQLYFAKRAKKDWPGKGKSKVEESRLIFTESEMISLIESIVLEEKRKKLTKADTYLKSSLGQSKKQEEDYIDSVVKKMKDYLKTGSKGKYEMSPKGFPKGNGELAKMDKMAYVPSKTVDEYITNFTAAALENLDYDSFEPNEERVSKYLKGSSETGNNPKWANAVETPVNDMRDKVRKNNYLAKLKKKAYNKSPQPVVSDKSGSESGADKIMMKLESVNGGEVINEMEKMKSLIGYNRKTQ